MSTMQEILPGLFHRATYTDGALLVAGARRCAARGHAIVRDGGALAFVADALMGDDPAAVKRGLCAAFERRLLLLFCSCSMPCCSPMVRGGSDTAARRSPDFSLWPQVRAGASHHPPKEQRAVSKNFEQIERDVTAGIGILRERTPDTMKAFGALAAAATATRALDSKTKELMALAIGIAVHCDGCVAYHVKQAHKHGASRDEITETVALAIYMGGGPAAVYGADALRAYDAFAEHAAR